MPTSLLFTTHRQAAGHEVQGDRLKLKHALPVLGEDDAGMFEAAFLRAIEMLDAGVAALGAPLAGPLAAQADVIFAGDLTDEERDKLAALLRLSADGLRNHPTLKITNKGRGGFVKSTWTASEAKALKFPDGTPWLRKGHMVKKVGAIHLTQERLSGRPDMAALTIAHEATHKYAGTKDHGQMGYWSETYNNCYRVPGLSHQQALINADSFSTFAYCAFRAQ